MTLKLAGRNFSSTHPHYHKVRPLHGHQYVATGSAAAQAALHCQCPLRRRLVSPSDVTLPHRPHPLCTFVSHLRLASMESLITAYASPYSKLTAHNGCRQWWIPVHVGLYSSRLCLGWQVRDALTQRAAPLDMLFVAVNQQGLRPDPVPATPAALDLSGLPGVHSWQPQRLRYAHQRRAPAALPDLAACLSRTGAAEPRPPARANPGGGSACVAEQPRQAACGSGSSGPMDVDAAPAAPLHGALANGGPASGPGLARPAERLLPAEAQANAQGGRAPGEPPRAGAAGVPAGVLAAVHEWLGAQACGFAGARVLCSHSAASRRLLSSVAVSLSVWSPGRQS